MGFGGAHLQRARQLLVPRPRFDAGYEQMVARMDTAAWVLCSACAAESADGRPVMSVACEGHDA